MANSDSAYLEQLKTARDILVANIISDEEVLVQITIRGRTKIVADPVQELMRLQDIIDRLELKVRDRNTPRWRFGSYRRAGYRCC